MAVARGRGHSAHGPLTLCLQTKTQIIGARGVRSGSLNISTRDDKREQVSTILVNISVNEAVVFTSIFQLLVVLAPLGTMLDADWSENDVRIGWSSVYCTMGRH